MKAVRAFEAMDPKTFHDELRPQSQPALIKGLVSHWPMVAAARAADEVFVTNIASRAADEPISYAIGQPEIEGRFHYVDDGSDLNYTREHATLGAFLHLLLAEAMLPRPRALAGQGLALHQCLPSFAPSHPMPLLPPSVMPRMWIGNAAKVATHNDELENIACVAAGHRRFTLFPPEAIADLYMGPFELTPGGTPVSMVHLTAPDFERYPRFAQALEVAQVAEMEPGDALYIPYQWYHHVEALDKINILINYWWDPARQDLGSPWDALLHGVIALRELPADQRRAWKAMFDHYVFLANGNPAAHLPAEAQGILAAASPEDIRRLKEDLLANLDPRGKMKQGPFA